MEYIEHTLKQTKIKNSICVKIVHSLVTPLLHCPCWIHHWLHQACAQATPCGTENVL